MSTHLNQPGSSRQRLRRSPSQRPPVGGAPGPARIAWVAFIGAPSQDQPVSSAAPEKPAPKQRKTKLLLMLATMMIIAGVVSYFLLR